MPISEYGELLAHMEWADALVWRSVLDLPQARANAEMRTRLHHIHLVQHLYLQIWRGEPMQIRELATFADLEAIHAWARPVYAQAKSFAASLTPESLQGEVRFPWAEQLRESMGEVHPATTAQSLFQIATHTAYHRGQVCTHLRQLGGEPPLTDFIAWVWQGQPDPCWSAPAVLQPHA